MLGGDSSITGVPDRERSSCNDQWAESSGIMG